MKTPIATLKELRASGMFDLSRVATCSKPRRRNRGCSVWSKCFLVRPGYRGRMVRIRSRGGPVNVAVGAATLPCWRFVEIFGVAK